MYERVQSIKQFWVAFAQQERGRRMVRWGRRFCVGGVVALLLYQMTEVGWGEIVRALPANPWFYLIFLVLYASLPVSEAFIYRHLWGFRYAEGLVAFLKKRVLNKDVLGYSGDVYIYFWARDRGFGSEREVRGAVKDNAIASSAASTFFAVSVLAGLFFAGHIAWTRPLHGHEVAYAAVALIVAAALVALAVGFRRAIFYLSGRAVATLFGIHLARLMLTNVLQVVQWSVVMPEAGWTVWGTLLSVQIVISRISFLPARDLIFIGAGVEAMRLVDVSSASVAGMLLASSAVDKVLNVLFFSLSTLLVRRKQGATGGPEVAQDLARV